MNKKLLPVLLVLAVGSITACSQKEPAAQASQAQTETKQVEIATAKRDKAARMSELSGTLQPSEEATVSFEVAGRIVELKRNEGDRVSAGDVLARLDASDYSLQLAKADTAVDQTQAMLEKTLNGAREQERIQAKAAADKAQLAYQKALDDFKRIERLYQEKAVSQNDYENAKNRLDIAQKDWLSAQQAYSLTVQGARDEDRQSQRSSYDQAVIGKQMAALTLSKTQLKAPISGTILSKLATTGSLVNVGTPVYRIGNVDTLKVVLPVPDREIAAWHVGDTVTLSLYDQQREGKVTKILPATNQNTGTIGVEVSVPNPGHDWFVGQVVKANRQIEGKVGIFVPVEAVVSQGGDKPYVFLAKAGKAVKTPVTIGEMIDNKLEILSGLKEGDQVIVKGADRLFDGDPIEAAGGNKP